jgi:predicted transcriptional regulator
MKVQDIMTQEVKFCGPDTNLAAATEILWQNNCGSLPVVDSDGKLLGVITDRDMCIALGTRNVRASEVAVRDAATKTVFTCTPNDEIHAALKTLRQHQIRRMPVIGANGKLVGILCLDEIVLHVQKTEGKTGISYEDVVNTLKAICEHRGAEVSKPATMAAGATPAF